MTSPREPSGASHLTGALSFECSFGRDEAGCTLKQGRRFATPDSYPVTWRTASSPSNNRSATLSIRPQRSLCVDLRKEAASWGHREPAPQASPAVCNRLASPCV